MMRLRFLTIYCLIICLNSCYGYWRFPGMAQHSTSFKEEDEIFKKTMVALLQPGAKCVPKDNQDILQKLYEWIKSQNDVHKVKDHVLSNKGKLCRFDVSICDGESKKCICNGNMGFNKKTESCLIRVGWPCTEGEDAQPGQCMGDAACRQWEGSYNYDTETFPTTKDFFTDSGYFCRCSAADSSRCGDLGDQVVPRNEQRIAPGGSAAVSLNHWHFGFVFTILVALLSIIFQLQISS